MSLERGDISPSGMKIFPTRLPGSIARNDKTKDGKPASIALMLMNIEMLKKI